jgi:hypothetical protein
MGRNYSADKLDLIEALHNCRAILALSLLNLINFHVLPDP